VDINMAEYFGNTPICSHAETCGYSIDPNVFERFCLRAEGDAHRCGLHLLKFSHEKVRDTMEAIERLQNLKTPRSVKDLDFGDAHDFFSATDGDSRENEELLGGH